MDITPDIAPKSKTTLMEQLLLRIKKQPRPLHADNTSSGQSTQGGW